MSNQNKVKTKKIIKRRLNLKRAFLFVCALVLIAFGLVSLVKIDATSIVVEGNNYLSDSNILKVANLKNKVSYLSTSKKICKNIKKLSLISDCKVEHTLTLKLVVHVTENRPLFYYSYEKKLALSSAELVDENNNYGVPTLINYVPKKILKEFITGLDSVSNDIIRSISDIEYSPSVNAQGDYIDEKRFILKMNDGNTVYVNNKNLDVLGMYDTIYASIGDTKGTYYFDCDYDNYYFTKY